MDFAVLVDLTKCIGCRACVQACKRWNQLPAERMDFYVGQADRTDSYAPQAGKRHRPKLSANTYCVVEYHELKDERGDAQWVNVKRNCNHCLEPACQTACPVGALHTTPEGPVVYEPHRCIGCRYCMMSCPFAVPSYQWERPAPYIRKCTFCYDRIGPKSAQPPSEHVPACVKACPVKTMTFGDRKEMLRQAKVRQVRTPRKYLNHIFGETDAGGTRWLYLSPVAFADLGFPINLGDKSYPAYTELALNMVPVWATGGGMGLAGLFWLWRRKRELAEQAEGGVRP